MTIIDISPTLDESTPVWPGDTPLSRRWLGKIADGSNIDLSTLTTTTHIGAHADAPSHYAGRGRTIEQVDLEPYVGPCIVIEVLGKKMISPDDCVDAIKQGAKRILVKTTADHNINGKSLFQKEFTAFDPEAIARMGENGVKLIGIDTSSVDPFDSKDLPAHNMLEKYDIRNLEGLELSHVAPGHYELIALPLKLRGFDASPVRAVLRPLIAER